MTYVRPCQEPENDPDDWFISRDGKQYPDDDFLTEDEVRGITKSVLPIQGETAEEHRDRVDRALNVAEADRKRRALTARRHAKEACFGCYFRTQCLDRALNEEQMHGTWGGYYEEELREIRREISRRKRRRQEAAPPNPKGDHGTQEQQRPA